MLERYIVKEAVGPFFFGLAAFTSLLTVNVLFTAMDMLNKGMAGRVVATWMGLNIPEILIMTFPMSMLLGTLLSFSRLSSNSEITAMRAGGMSLWRAMAPLIAFGLMLSLLGVWMNDKVVAPAKKEADRLVSGSPQDLLKKTVKENFYYPTFESGKPRSILMAQRFDGTSGRLDGVYMFEFEPTGTIRVINARYAIWDGHVWKFVEGYIQQLAEADTYQFEFDSYTVINAPPPDLMAIPDNSKTANMTFAEHRAFIELLESRGSDSKLASVEYHTKFSLPFACLVFTIIGVPFGLQPHRGGSSVGLGLSMVLIFGYYVMTVISRNLGQNGTLAPQLAAWAPDMVFGTVGLGMITRKSRT